MTRWNSKLPKGVYILVLTIDNRSKAWKIIKE
ncbi:MAG: T9SS type A sorting domain-containing protein [Bacteroidales bacterium]|nr:T9SS type A sorting domain-containing protein [Bacteroidales bacterium]